jgi:CheY-like chemotaxis protein
MTLSHELRTPLNAIWGWTRILRTHPSDRQRLDHGLEVIERNARVQLQLIEDLLDISRIVAGKLRLNVQPVKLAAVAAVVSETMRPAADAKGVALELVVDGSAQSGGVNGDPDRLQQVLWNLVSNAVKFTARDGRIAIRVAHGTSFAQVVVSDTGEGIDAALLPVIFDRFRQGHSGASRPHAGLGIGLAIARNLVEAHGGTLNASSPGQGRGATFTIKLPLAVADSALFEDLSLAAVAVRGDRLDGVRVLAVDADIEHGELLDTALRDEGAVVEVVSSAAAALEALAPFAPDVVISDIELPFEDGHALIRRIRANESGRRALAAIALTASPRADDRINALDAGFHAYLAKPVEPAELTALILSLLNVGPRDIART